MRRARRLASTAAGAYLTVGIVLVAAGIAAAPPPATTAPEPPGATAPDAPDTPSVVIRNVQPAQDPFASLTSGTIRVGGRRVEVVVADSLGERIRGLRGRSDAAPYAGMLFVFPQDTTTAFTMSGVPTPLDIAFFDRRGRRVDRLRMRPCAGTDASCPSYRAARPFRYSLETAPGEMPEGRLRMAPSGRSG